MCKLVNLTRSYTLCLKKGYHIYSAIFVPKITGIGQLLLKLSLVVGWYPFFETQCRRKPMGELSSEHTIGGLVCVILRLSLFVEL